MSKFFIRMAAVIVAAGLVLAACDNPTGGGGDGGNGGNGGNMTGTYTGTIMGAGATLTISSAAWTISIPSLNVNMSGTYTQSGSTATMRDNTNTTIGTGVLIGNTLTITLNTNSGAAGTYTFTKSGGNSDNSGNGGNGGASGGKPTDLASSATADEALATLDAIISYSGTPAETKTGAEALKNQWSAISSAWATMNTSIIYQINNFIRTIPDDNNTGGNGGTGDSGTGGNSGSMAGTYTGTIMGAGATLTVTSAAWTISIPNLNINMTGTYMQSGSTATLYSGGTTFGTAVLRGNTLAVTSSASGSRETYYFTKVITIQSPEWDSENRRNEGAFSPKGL
jgi:hypothetical protein